MGRQFWTKTSEEEEEQTDYSSSFLLRTESGEEKVRQQRHVSKAGWGGAGRQAGRRAGGRAGRQTRSEGG
ncbi:MAG: hypothetical protein ACK53L_25750, partial [Pirellulaceae bacterium]